MDGTIIVDKHEGMTSHDVVNRVRRICGTRRVGHAGTLDPFATGVLVVCVNRATRLANFLVHLDKEYLATVRLGFATDTQDLTGKQITPLRSSNETSLEALGQTLREFVGPQLQTPPMYSAKKVAGERLYQAARQGREVERRPVPITVYALELAETDEPPLKPNEDGTGDFMMRVRCSSGTYVRTLAHDIGARLGVGAHLAALRRTAVGHFSLAQAVTLDGLERRAREGTLAEVLVGMADTVAHLPAVRLDAAGAQAVAHGREFSLARAAADSPPTPDRPLRLLDADGRLLAVGLYQPGKRSVRPITVLSAAGQG